MLESIYQHLCLSAALPGREEQSIREIEQKLADRFVFSARNLRDVLGEAHRQLWDDVRRILVTSKSLNAGRNLNKASLLDEFRSLGHRDLLILHVVEQNAGLLIWRRHGNEGDSVVFEAFEASALSESVLAAKNALEWDFPGVAASIPFAVFTDPSFQKNLATFLEQASNEPIMQFAARARKAGSSPSEIRETARPDLITQLLMAMLEGLGTRIFPPSLRKRVRDEVCWNGGQKPWRRSPFWLVVRVGLQRYLYRLLGGEVGRAHYKFYICHVLAGLMDDMVGALDPELVHLAKAKFNRRLTKLEVDKDRACPAVRGTYDHFFQVLSPGFRKSNATACQWIEQTWSNYRRSIQRQIQRLPFRATSLDMRLTLPNSGAYLTEALRRPLNASGSTWSAPLLNLPAEYTYTTTFSRPARNFAHRYLKLAAAEAVAARSSATVSDETSDPEKVVMLFAARINEYLKTASSSYSDSLQKSMMILTVMELWMTMDEHATQAYQLLKEYRPDFHPGILDVLQLLRAQDMVRLQKIQSHLLERERQCKVPRMSIFDEPARNCFAQRYFDSSDESAKLQRLYEKIEAEAALAKSRKEMEWQRMSAEHESLSQQVALGTCIYYTPENGSYAVHDDRACTKCFLQRKAKKMKIQIYEHPLPFDSIKAKAIVFELVCPKFIAAYRDATWNILSTLGQPDLMAGSEPRMHLHEYSELRSYGGAPAGRVSLASTTKSFLSSHYSHIGFPIAFDEVCRPNGLKLGYHDAQTRTWPGRVDKTPTFRHHCPLSIPANSPFQDLRHQPAFRSDGNGPSSYEIMASQTKCPAGLNEHEFLSYQSLFSGKARRWLSILLELGSSNLNFSTEATASLVSQLALQAGPAHESDHLRAIHIVFRDPSFCSTLLKQLAQRLDSILSNWRETNCMEMLIILLLRVCSVACRSTVQEQAMVLLLKARSGTSKWVRVLRQEILKAQDANSAQRYGRYVFWAALLSKLTFALRTTPDDVLSADELQCFIESAVTLQDNLVEDPATLSTSHKSALIRDLKMTYEIRDVLRRSILSNVNGLYSALNVVWPQPEGAATRNYCDLKFFSPPEEWWVQLTIDATEDGRKQVAHYHVLEGHLLIDGKALGKLPAEHRKSFILEQLFGNQSLLVYPSNMPGMSYQLALVPFGNQIHIGFSGHETVIRARHEGHVYELIPREVFGSFPNSDLPAPLIENCVHWLNLRTHVMEIRHGPRYWKFQHSHWTLDMKSRHAQRRQSRLIDPQSPLAKRVASVFDRFEYPHQLTVFQPRGRNLTVELQRLDLQFVVNGAHLLESSQLQCTIDPDQDAGCWYGLNSKIVLRGTSNPFQRSMIVPLGPLSFHKRGFHVGVDVQNHGYYAKFNINAVLGQLECPVEPRLVFRKAQFHALTSFVVPDSLTGRTGTEQALSILSSGSSQPWTSLSPVSLDILREIAALSCTREYYPRDLRAMQKVTWNEHLTTTIQSDDFWPAVDKIWTRSHKLHTFAPQKDDTSALAAGGSPFLRDRSAIRRRLFIRRACPRGKNEAAQDVHYSSRDRSPLTQAHRNVIECVTLIRRWPSSLHSAADLAGVLQACPTIQGFETSFEKVLLSDHLDVDFAAQWGALVRTCRSFKQEDQFKMIFLLGTMAFSPQVNMDIISTLIAHSTLAELKAITLPSWPVYIQYRHNQVPHSGYLVQLLRPFQTPYPGDERSLGFQLKPKQRRKLEAAEAAHNAQVENDADAFAQFLLKQWPCTEPSIRSLEGPLQLDTSTAMDALRPEWLRLSQNLELSGAISQTQAILDKHRCERLTLELQSSPNDLEAFPARIRGREVPTLTADLIQVAGPETSCNNEDALATFPELHSQGRGLVLPHLRGPPHKIQRATAPASPCAELEAMIRPLIGSSSNVRQKYGRDLMSSLHALQMAQARALATEIPIVDLGSVHEKLKRSANQRQMQLDHIMSAFQMHDSRVQWLMAGGLYPEVTPVTVLQTLRSTSSLAFGCRMKESIIRYGILTTEYQRLRRLEDALLKGQPSRVQDETQNQGHANWSPLEAPDWLLLEIDANILIRKDQIEVAKATVSPASRSNSVLQMNMGLGKTSVIIPMVAAMLANSKQLARVIVPKPLLLQTAQLLQARLGGLLGRSIGHVPFSRKTAADPSNARTNLEVIKMFHELHRETLKSSGIVLALPEHIMSFMMSGQQRLSDARVSEATPMLNIQSWLGRVCRDVLDESDYILAVQTQLIYPSGPQRTVDGHPHRWETVEALLCLVEGHLFNLRTQFPQSIQFVSRPEGGFPFIYFSRQDAEDALIARLVEDVCSGRSSVLQTQQCSRVDRQAIRQFISDVKVRKGVQERVERLCPENPALKKTVFLLRGLFVHRILLLTLKKRWNVQYGLHPDRDPIAVPFHAKGVPSAQAEWGHPDVAILFTCLSFLYGGVNIRQARQCLEHVGKGDDPSSEFERWASASARLPGTLREWNAINVDDEIQLEELHRHLQYNSVVINYFLNHFVFPKHAKQFRVKLQSSGWDIPLFSATQGLPVTFVGVQNLKTDPENDTTKLTTGFSGTNDNKTLLPLNIEQADLPSLAHTNAEVIKYLLEPRNRQYVVAADACGRHLREVELLKLISSMEIRVLIDAGAQILEMDNFTLVDTWLDVFTMVPAAVYFDSENKPYALHRRGRKKMPLSASPYADKLEDCLIYLDEAHTRGTDLKMPPKARGALTLGLGQTKDHTVQAAMRLRQLGSTQSVTFFAPPEVHQSILDLRRGQIRESIDSQDVVCWLLEQTCAGIEQLQPLYYSQGADYCRRVQAAVKHPDVLKDAEQREAYLNVLRQTERQSLEQLYTPKSSTKGHKSITFSNSRIADFMKDLETRRKGFQDTGLAVHGSALQEVEQEREVAFEVESVREVQKPVHFIPCTFMGLHKDIASFARTGRLLPDSSAYRMAFAALKRTALGEKHGVDVGNTSGRLYVSAEFLKTVQFPAGRPQDSFQRSINYLLYSVSSQVALIINPEEAELLLPDMRSAVAGQTHLILYAPSVTRKMIHFNELRYYSVPTLPESWTPPTWLVLEIGIFAGRLYFNHSEYSDLMKLLCLDQNETRPTDGGDDSANPDNDPGQDRFAEGAMDGATEEAEAKPRSFTAKPLSFLQELLAIRRKGQDFAHTPMGYICQGKPLFASHPFFAQAGKEEASRNVSQPLPVFQNRIKDEAKDDDLDSGSDFSEEAGEANFLSDDDSVAEEDEEDV